MPRKIIIVIVVVLTIFLIYRQTHKDYYDYLTMSGATPLAVARQVPSDFHLEIERAGQESIPLFRKRPQRPGHNAHPQPGKSLRTANTWVPIFTWASRYLTSWRGSPPKSRTIIPLTSRWTLLWLSIPNPGETVYFSFNELIMTGDCYPPTLAFSRKPVRPTNETVQETYAGNRLAEALTGFRLICPKEPDTARYLDNVVRISYKGIPLQDADLPPRRKKTKCHSGTIGCIDGNKHEPGLFEEATPKTRDRWIRIGHGHGFDDIAAARGYDLRTFIEANFSGISPDDFFLFVACDGYRALFLGSRNLLHHRRCKNDDRRPHRRKTDCGGLHAGSHRGFLFGPCHVGAGSDCSHRPQIDRKLRMFTTGAHIWLYAGVACNCAAWILYIAGRQAAGRVVLAAGVLLTGLYLIGRGWLGDVFIPNPIVEGPFFLPWCLALIALVRSIAKPQSGLTWMLGLVVIFSILSAFYAKGMIPPTPEKITFWALLFFTSESLAHALFYSAALYAFLELTGKDLGNSFHPLLVWGFVVYTMAQVTGAVWCFVGWGNTFSWGNRHLLSCRHLDFFCRIPAFAIYPRLENATMPLW